jgi:hypothetical protein
VEAVYADENVWLSQKMMAQLYDVEVPTINYHLKKVFEDSELEEDSVIQHFRITATDGKSYDTKHYNLSAIIAVGYKVNSERAGAVSQVGHAHHRGVHHQGIRHGRRAPRARRLRPERSLLRGATPARPGDPALGAQVLPEDHRHLRDVRRLRRDGAGHKALLRHGAEQLHWAIHGQTAAEVIVGRADSSNEHMGLHTWTDAPHGKIQKFDVVVAKNYLAEHELAQLSRLVNAYLVSPRTWRSARSP